LQGEGGYKTQFKNQKSAFIKIKYFIQVSIAVDVKMMGFLALTTEKTQFQYDINANM